MRKAVLSLTVLTPSRRRTLALLAVCLIGMVALFGVGLRTAETQTTTTSTPTYYKVQDLGSLGGSRGSASALNDSGQVVGYSYTAGDQNYHAFLYDSTNNGMKDLDTLGGTNSEAKSINKSGQVVGSSYTSSGDYHAFIYDSTNGMKDLNDLIPADSGWSIGEATAINTDGKIAATGWPPSWRGPCNPYAEYWPDFDTALVLRPGTSGKYEVQGLGTLGGDYSYATGINDSGQVVGRSMTSGCGEQLFLYDENANPKMQGLGGTEAKGINGSGKVVGYTYTWDGYNYQCTNEDCYRAFLYDNATKQMQVLGTLGTGATYGTIGSEAYGINDSDKVVGLSGIGDGQHHWVSGSGPAYGFIYDSTNGMKDLNSLIPTDLGWTIDQANAINTGGEIAATGHKDGVGRHALLLTPTNEIPTPKITSPPNNTYTVDSFSVSGSAVPGSTVELFEGTTSTGKTTNAASSTGAWSIALSGVSVGAHAYSAKAKDAQGNTSPASNTVTVTVDKTPPKVSSVTPTSNAKNVALNPSVTATFSEKIDPKMLITTPTDSANPNLGTSTTFTLVKSGTTKPILSAKVSYDDSNKTVTLTPSPNLAAGTKYTAKLSSGVKDLAGNALTAYTWSFTTSR